jgi:hypothetical protein
MKLEKSKGENALSIHEAKSIYIFSMVYFYASIEACINLMWIYIPVAVLPSVLGGFKNWSIFKFGLASEVVFLGGFFVILYLLFMGVSYSIFFRRLKRNKIENISLMSTKEIGKLIGSIWLKV